MNDLLVQLDDLPDEILLHIFRKLDNVEALFYLIDVNQRLNRILHDPIFTSNLSLLLYYSDRNSIYPLCDLVLDRFCSTILPQIGHQIETLFLEGTSTNRILRASNYPNLHCLSLYNIEVEVAKSLFADKNIFNHIYRYQISTFAITFTMLKNSDLMPTYAFIFKQILTNLTDLKCLKFHPYSNNFDALYFGNSPPTVISSTLLELHVRVKIFRDCLYLLDGRFDQLRAFYVTTSMSSDIYFSLPTEHKEMLLPNLRIFSFGCYDRIYYNFDELVIPLLQRMINLEELELLFEVKRVEGFFDGNTLRKDIISHMPRLYKFTFNICSIVHHDDQNNFPSDECIQKTFECYYDNDIIVCVNHFQDRELSQCLIYSYPYKLPFYNNVTNNFSGGLFTSVTKVSLYDERPFEYEFFVRIAQSFPFMKELIIHNEKAQNDKHLITSPNDNQPLSIIEYANLTILDVRWVHDDYVELFLLDTKVSLPNNVHLLVGYERLKRVTYNFTRDATRNNCRKLASLDLCSRVVDECMKNYFPHTRIV